MAFFMPKAIGATAPAPLDPEVRIENFGERTFAAFKYSGNVNEERISEGHTHLMHELSAHSELMPQGRLVTAQYDQPFAVPVLKTNEALIELRPSLV